MIAIFIYSSAVLSLYAEVIMRTFDRNSISLQTGAWTADGRRTDRQGVPHMNQI